MEAARALRVNGVVISRRMVIRMAPERWRRRPTERGAVRNTDAPLAAGMSERGCPFAWK